MTMTPTLRSIALVVLCASVAACGDGEKGEDVPETPPVEALAGTPIFPFAQQRSQGASAQAIERSYLARAFPPDTVADWYRRTIDSLGWTIVGDVKTPDGAVTIHAERQGPPFWVMIRPNPNGEGTVFSLLGAIVDTVGRRQ